MEISVIIGEAATGRTVCSRGGPHAERFCQPHQLRIVLPRTKVKNMTGCCWYACRRCAASTRSHRTAWRLCVESFTSLEHLFFFYFSLKRKWQALIFLYLARLHRPVRRTTKQNKGASGENKMIKAVQRTRTLDIAI